MARRERTVPASTSADGPFLEAMLDTLDDLFDLLDERLPRPAERDKPKGDGTVRLTEPAVPSPSDQPAAEGRDELFALTEPAQITEPKPDPDEPDDKPTPAKRAAKKTTAARRRSAKEES